MLFTLVNKGTRELAGRVSQDKSLLPVEVRGSCPPAAGPNHWSSRRRTSTTGVSGEQCVSAPTSVTRQRQPSGPGVEAETERERQRARVWARPSLVARSRSSQEAGQVQERPLAAAVCAGRFHVASTRHEGWEERGPAAPTPPTPLPPLGCDDGEHRLHDDSCSVAAWTLGARRMAVRTFVCGTCGCSDISRTPHLSGPDSPSPSLVPVSSILRKLAVKVCLFVVCPNSSNIGVGGNDCQELNSTFVLWRREVEFPSSGPRALDERLCRDYYRSTRGRRARLPESADSHPFLPLPSPTLLPSVSSPVPPPSPPTTTVVSGPTARLAARRGAVGPRPARRVDGGGCRPPPGRYASAAARPAPAAAKQHRRHPDVGPTARSGGASVLL
ncbi:hypothetical protein C0Q70_16643 [Pomacea canaliculata]|uniref:Uncharacterized protein n=1 Tax=Pomacea canaliculata TaxID=400727 RepID=A0A2T7NQC8_POMCA|nr:hypothetical protein C0Q70_16643 [Pomacea canaliculata]